MMAEHVYPWLERCFDCWSGGEEVVEFQAAAVPDNFIVNAWQEIMVRERWREEGEEKGGRGYGCALIQPAGAISPIHPGEPKGDLKGLPDPKRA